jgi:hypothetical protein
MKCLSALPFALCLAFSGSAALAAPPPTDTIPVRHPQGTLRGFLAMRAPDGHIIAYGDLAQVARATTVTDHLTFHFRDGSIDDETTVFSAHGSFRLISDHHTQTGPSFPKSMDLLIDVTHGRVVSHTKDKDGKDQEHTDQLALPANLANGLVSLVLQNINPNAPITRVPMLVTSPKPRIVTLEITPRGEESYSLLGNKRPCLHFSIKIDIGGVAGVIAPIIGKQPPDIQVWIVGGDAPSFLREQGQSFEDGPIWTVEFSSPDFADSTPKDPAAAKADSPQK